MTQVYSGPFKLSYRAEYGDVPALEWQIDKVLPKGSVTMLYGEPKNGKTYVSLAMILAVLTGTRWCGLTVEQAAVLYISPEGYYTLLRRQDAWQNLNYGGKQVRLPILRHPVNMLQQGTVLQAAQALLAQGVRPGFVVIDTLQWAALGASANDDNAMKAFFDNVARAPHPQS
jgi:RecA-family ATPase